jgi:hypothetical protein
VIYSSNENDESVRKSKKAWVTPQSWLDDPAFAEHVGYKEWSTYAFKALDDEWHPADEYHKQTLEYMLLLTDEYLEDHAEVVEEKNKEKHLNRYLLSFLKNETFTNESIPTYLTPELHRGVAYSDELIEMKGKLSLHPAFSDDFTQESFVHSETNVMMNKVGTIREQYDWLPRADLEHLIEPEKLEKIAPILRFVNFAADLQSTKVILRVLTFNTFKHNRIH